MFNFITNLYANYKVYIIAATIAGLLASTFALGYRAASNACEAEKLEVLTEALEEKAAVEKALHELSVQYETDRAAAKLKQDDLTQRLKNEVKTDDAYKRAIPVTGLRLLAEAVANANTR